MKVHVFNKKEESLLNLALELKSKSKYKESLDIFLDVHQKHGKHSSIINGLVASVYFELKDYERSAEYFLNTTTLNPKSELASVGLFHSLVEIGEDDLAMKEIKRYLSDYPLDKYKYTIKELHEESDNILSDEMEKLISEYYQKYSLEKLIT